MKISELIDLLHGEMLWHGDIEVFVTNSYGWDVEPIIEVSHKSPDPREDDTKKLVLFNDG